MKTNTILAVAFLCVVGFIDAASAQTADKKPNILYFHVDNTSVGDWGCYGGAYPLGAKTPNLDRFAAEGLKLTNYNVESQCTPSRAALMTGRIEREQNLRGGWSDSCASWLRFSKKSPSKSLIT